MSLYANYALQAIADFEHPFIVNHDGTLSDAVGVYAPEVYHDSANDVEVYGDNWEPLTGYTGQYSYNGAVMHSSEYIGGRLARDILETPGTYVVVVVNVHADADGFEPEPAGWAILKQVTS